jgi:hypothetical protein
MKQIFWITGLLALMVLSACGGAKKPVKTEPPPPIDTNLLDLVPYEADLVLIVDFAELRASPLWSVIDKTLFKTEAIDLPADKAMDPLSSCNEAILAFMDSEQYGSQLLIIVKGDVQAQSTALKEIAREPSAVPQSADGFQGTRTKEMSLLSLTPNTMVFGNDAIVRMSAKTGLKKSRSIVENPNFASLKDPSAATARMVYRSGLNTKTTERFKSAVPRINPDSITGVDGSLTTGTLTLASLKFTTETEMDASIIARELNRMLSELKGNMIVLFLGLDWLQNRITIASEKNVVSADISLDQRDLETLNQLADRIQKIQELLKGMDQGNKDAQ